MPSAPEMCPPFSFMIVISFCGMFDAPCKTNGNVGIRLVISDNISKRNSWVVCLRLYAPWLVPIEIAKESIFVADTNFSILSGFVYVLSVPNVFSSSKPDNVPNSASTVMLWG